MSKKIKSTATTILNCPTGTTTSTSYDDDGYGRFTIDKSLFSNIKAIYYRATLTNTAGGTYSIYAELVDDGGTLVTGGELTASLPQWGQSIQTSADIKAGIAATATVYRFKYKVAAGGNGGSLTNEIIIQYYV